MNKASQFRQKDDHLREDVSWRCACTAESIIHGQHKPIRESEWGRGQ